jgi:glycosyltransferase involved in cell wall biosynthesis
MRHGTLPAEALAGALGVDSVALWLFDDNPINRARSPVKLLELLAHGRAVVAEGVGEVSTLADGAALLVAPGDTETLVEEAIRLLTDSIARRRLGQQAQVAMQRGASWRARAEQLSAWYSSTYT